MFEIRANPEKAKRIFRHIFPQRIRTREAIFISIIFHLIIAAALSSFLVGSFYVQSHESANSLEFELLTERIEIRAAAPKATAAQALETVGGSSGAEQSAAMASLAGLSQLRESFNFIVHATTADSAVGFSPVEGKAPGTGFYGAAIGNGVGSGAGGGIHVVIGGGGVCLPGPGRY